MVIFRDESVVSQAIELNEQLQKVLARHDDLVSERAPTNVNEQLQKGHARHDDLISGRVATNATHFDPAEEEEEEEEPEQLVRRCLELNSYNFLHEG